MECSVEGCGREARSVRSGLCGTHYARLNRSGRLDLPSPSERFWSHVDKGADGTNCWLWTGKLDTNGYARFWVKPNTLYAHRFAYESIVGPIPPGLTIDHRCRVRHCVNPSHLAPETLQDNVRMARSANAEKVSCPQGHDLDIVNSNGRRECSTCSRDRKRRHARRVQTFKRLDIPTGIATVDDLTRWLVKHHRKEVTDALRKQNRAD